MTTSRPRVQLFTDGACLGNPGPGGWAYICRNPRTGDEYQASGGERNTTNNRMELLAVIRGLESLSSPHESGEHESGEVDGADSSDPASVQSKSPRGYRIELIGDSEYVLKGLTEWMAGWKKRNWRKADKKPVLNAELWRKLDALQANHELTITWVRGHTGHIENEHCDKLAKAEAMKRSEPGRSNTARQGAS